MRFFTLLLFIFAVGSFSSNVESDLDMVCVGTKIHNPYQWCEYITRFIYNFHIKILHMVGIDLKPLPYSYVTYQTQTGNRVKYINQEFKKCDSL